MALLELIFLIIFSSSISIITKQPSHPIIVYLLFQGIISLPFLHCDYLPYPKWLEMSKLTEGGFTTSVEPSSVNPKEQKNNIQKNKNKKDKIDKTQDLSMPCEEIKHNIVTNANG